MTRVRARYGPDGYSVVSVGHAGTETACTAVSAIIGALAGWVDNAGAGGISLSNGEALIAFPDTIPGAEAVMDMTVIGLLQIAKAEPDSVKVEVFGRAVIAR